MANNLNSSPVFESNGLVLVKVPLPLVMFIKFVQVYFQVATSPGPALLACRFRLSFR